MDGNTPMPFWTKEFHLPPELTKEEALARPATAYFRSHAPATLQDFSSVVRFAFNGSKAIYFSDRTGTDVRTMEQPDMVHP